MKALIVEDDFVSRKLLSSFLSPYGEHDVAANGQEALNAFFAALEKNEPYDLIFLDIMMPELNGRETLLAIRREEKKRNIGDFDGVRIIMTTSLDDKENVLGSFREGCEAYLTKPLDKALFTETLAKFGYTITAEQERRAQDVIVVADKTVRKFSLEELAILVNQQEAPLRVFLHKSEKWIDWESSAFLIGNAQVVLVKQGDEWPLLVSFSGTTLDAQAVPFDKRMEFYIETAKE